MVNFNWSCSYCHHAQVVTDERYHKIENFILVGDVAEGSQAIVIVAIGCANTKCRQLTVTVNILPAIQTTHGRAVSHKVKGLFSKKILPQGLAKPQPACVPTAIREDYVEACLIRDDSPKASATLARRCLQGMIRDFCGFSLATLDLEIKRLHKMLDENTAPKGVSIESVNAIDEVRKIGNIGAHMERDIDHIINVDPMEAQALIELLEMLFEEWYVAREHRAARLKQISVIAASKKKAIQDAKGNLTTRISQDADDVRDIQGRGTVLLPPPPT